MKAKFKKNPNGSNYILQGEGFYISYLPNTHANKRLENFNLFGGLFGVETGGRETALYTPQEPKWRILNGDFRKEYEEAFPGGLKACIAVYNKHKAARSDWSTDKEES